MKTSNRRPAKASLNNDQVTLLSLLLLGGELDAVDTEDVAIRADELSPGRFRWRKYKEHVDLGLVRNGLQDARKKHLVNGGALDGWRLTVEGAEEARRLALHDSILSKQHRLTPEQKQWRARERERLIREPAYREAMVGGLESVTPANIMRFFKFDEYLPDDKRTERIRRLLIAFEEDQDLHSVIQHFAKRLKL